ncbi:3985_t:CDS:2, partial [Scutellospora calospora]
VGTLMKWPSHVCFDEHLISLELELFESSYFDRCGPNDYEMVFEYYIILETQFFGGASLFVYMQEICRDA